MANPVVPVQSTTEIANLALAHCSVSRPIGDLDSEQSTEAQLLRTYYGGTVLEVLREMPWNFARKFATPVLVAGPNPQATIEWQYAYRYPADCVKFVRFVSLRLKNDSRQSRIPYTIASDNQGLLLYTDWPGSSSLGPVTIEYTSLNQNIAQYPADFVEMLALLLAVKVIKPLTAGDPYQLKPALMADYTTAKGKAQSANLNEEQRPEEVESEFVRGRSYEDFGITGVTGQIFPGGFTVT